MKDIFAQLISALQYTHAQGFAHRDIKLENILIDSKGEILLTDWSLCTKWKPGQMHKDYVGSSAYMSPEVMDGKPYEGPELDIWSAGIVLYALLFNVLPFESPTTDVSRVRSKKKRNLWKALRYIFLCCLGNQGEDRSGCCVSRASESVRCCS